MPKDRVSGYSQPKTAPMSPSYAYTTINSIPYADDEDEDFCVVCEGECTCGASTSAARVYSPPSLPTPTARSPLPAAAVLPPSPVTAPRPTLKIKFSAKLLPKSRNSHIPPSSSSNAHSSSFALKKLGRTKSAPRGTGKSALIAAGPRAGPKPKPRPRAPGATIATTTTKHATKVLPNFKKFNDNNKKNKKKKAANASPWVASASSSGSELTDIDDIDAMLLDDNFSSSHATTTTSTTAPAPRFPTFVAASAMDSGTASDSSDDSDAGEDDSSAFDSDSSMEAEEESFIIADARRQKERVRRELLGDDAAQRTRAHNGGGDWEIKPRMRSVGLDGGSDAGSAGENEDDSGVETGDEEEDGVDAEEDEEEEEEEDEEDERRAFVGVATGWSEDEESGVDDAELFFANLISHSEDSMTESDDDDDMEPVEIAPTLPAVAEPAQPAGLQITHGWDGEVVFTNGFVAGTSFNDADLAYLFASDSASDAHDTDSAMLSSGSDGEVFEDDEDDDGGETTDEELVDDAGLPTPRAMALFQPPTAVSVSAVNPLSTLSFATHRGMVADSPPLDPPAPEDVLAGRATFDHDHDSDEHDYDGLAPGRRSRSASWASSSREGAPTRVPRMGVFEGATEVVNPARSAVIDGSKSDVPSPFQRRRLSTRSRSRAKSLLSSVDSPLTPASLQLSDTVGSFAVPASQFTEHTQDSIQLDDVLHSSILLADEPEDSADPTTTTGDESSAPPPSSTASSIANLNRWDFVPINAFRQTLDSPVGTWRTSSDQMLKESPFSQLLWPPASEENATPTRAPTGRRRRSQSAAAAATGGALSTSPVFLSPLRAGDARSADREATPTPGMPVPATPQTKSRKDLRRERRLARKTPGVAPPHHHQNHHYALHHARAHQHHHHPNGKSRSSGSMQRSGFFSSPVGSVGGSFGF